MMSEKYFPQPSVMSSQAHFSRVPKAEIQRSRFDRSSGHKSTYNAGNLIPVFLDEALPGDTFHMNATVASRLATPLKPVMDNLYQDLHFFFVPSRLLWEHWVNFMGERDFPDQDPKDFSIPQANWNPTAALTHAYGDEFAVGDYLGLPKYAGDNNNHEVSALPLRALILIWNEWYRDENLQEPLLFDKGDTEASSYNMAVKYFPRGKRKDYFTGALPWPQKGDAVTIPLGGDATIRMGENLSSGHQGLWFNKAIYNGGSVENLGTLGSSFISDTEPSVEYSERMRVLGSPTSSISSVTAAFHKYPDTFQTAAIGASIPEDSVLPFYTDLQSATAMSINALRTAFQLQRMLERDARGGTRYVESIWAHFGVVNPDFRLQRPEFLGSGTGQINISPIASTYTTSGNAPQGNLAAVGTGVTTCKWSHSFTEHGYIVGLMSARADLTYQRGVERLWSRRVREEFYFPSLAHLGEQAILNKEIWLAPEASNTNDAVFGYQERFAEYRYKPSRITGLFASEESASLDVWHWSQDFTQLPELNDSFIVERPPIARTIAVQTEPHFLFDSWFDLKCDRPMPVYSVPGLIDHF